MQKWLFPAMFASYIDKFMQLKQQASGYPSWVVTEQDQERYILEYEEKEGGCNFEC